MRPSLPRPLLRQLVEALTALIEVINGVDLNTRYTFTSTVDQVYCRVTSLRRKLECPYCSCSVRRKWLIQTVEIIGYVLPGRN